MHSQSQLKPSYKVTIFCTDKGKILKVTPTTTPTLTKLQFCTWETNVKDLHVCVCGTLDMSDCVCVCRLSVECNWNPWQHNASQLLHGEANVGRGRRWRRRRIGRGEESRPTERHHLPQCGRQKQFSQLYFCAGPRLENELQVVWSRGMLGGWVGASNSRQLPTTITTTKTTTEVKFNNGGHGCCYRWWWQSLPRTGL